MNHSIDFFRDEIRNGFYIPSAIKQSWANALDVLAEIDRICVKHNIKYFADWGTFLGAVRHGGFVPWDDDLDICMLRDDYEKFLRVADAELPPEFCIHDYRRHEDHWLFLSRVVNNSRICFDENHLNSHYNFPWLSAVDIFIKDYRYKDPLQEKERCDEILFILAVAEGVITEKTDSVSLSANLNKLEKKYSMQFPTENICRELAVSLYALAEKQMARVPKEEAEEVSQLFPWGLKGIPGEPKACYENATYIPFEDTSIPVPGCYNQSLSAHYGDYNIIKKGVSGHDYPSFEGQRKNFETAAGVKLPRFSFDASFLNINRDPDSSESPNGSKCSSVSRDTTSKRKVLFLPIGPREWSGFETTYNKEISDPDTEVQVVPLPLMPKNCLGQIMLSDNEITASVCLDGYPKSLPLMNWEDYDLEQQTPDTIYIQSPYDAENPYLTVPPYYYAENLIFYTKELVYIPIGPVADFSKNDIPDQKAMDFYVTMPGVILSDKIFLHSKCLKANYVDKLTAFTEDASTRSIWESRICVVPDLYSASGSSVCESSKSHSAEAAPIQSSGISSRKKLLYCISSYELFEHAANLGSAISERMNLLKDCSEKVEISVCLYPADNITAHPERDSQKADDFNQLICSLASSASFAIVSFDMASAEEFVFGFDSYYGSSSPLVPIFVAQKKPVMLADYELDL